MAERKLEFHAYKNLRHYSVDLAILNRGADGDIHSVGTGVTMAPPPPPHEFSEPTLRLHLDEAQALLEALLSAGVRPRSEGPPAAEVAAMQRHLADVQGYLRRESRRVDKLFDQLTDSPDARAPAIGFTTE